MNYGEFVSSFLLDLQRLFRSNVLIKSKGLTVQKDIEKKIESIGEKIKIEIDHEKREFLLEHLYAFQWGLRKTFLKK